MSSYIMTSPIDSENYFIGENDSMDSPSQPRRSRSDSSSLRKGGGVVRALRELGKRPWLPSPLDAAAKWLSTSYETKNEDFRRLFKSLPPNAMLLDDYSCALQRDILVHGRMYVSQEHVSFYANIFGWETIVVVPLKRIASVSREKTAHVFPNALQIMLSDGVEINGTFSTEPKPHGNSDGTTTSSNSSGERSSGGGGGDTSSGEADRSTLHNKLWFTSFVSRDTTHTVLMKAWQNVLVDSPLSPVQLRNFSCRCWGEKPDVTVEMAQAIMSGASTIDDRSQMSGERSNDSDQPHSSRGGSHEKLTEEAGFEVITSSEVDSLHESSLAMDVPAEAVDTLSDMYEPVECGCSGHRESYLNQTFDCSVDVLFQLLFTNSEFYKVFCRQHKTIDLRMQEWTATEGDGQHREVTYTLTLNKTMGPKFSPTTETQHCLDGSTPGKLYRVDVEVCNGGIPYGDVFCTEHRYCLTRMSRYQSHLYVGADIHYRKSCWGLVKTFIERHCFQGMESYYKDLADGLDEECLKLPNPAGTSRRPSRSPSLSGSLAGSRASLPCDKSPSPNTMHEQVAEAVSAATDAGGRVVCRCGGALSSSGGKHGSSRPTTPSSSAVPADSMWTFSNMLMLCLLLALLLNIGLLLHLSWRSPAPHGGAPLAYDSVSQVFATQRDQWTAALLHRQQALQASLNAFPQFAGTADFLVSSDRK